MESESSSNEGDNDKVFFDGKCPICQREIEHLSKSGSQLKFIDVHSTQDLPYSLEEHLKLLHVTTSEGRVIKGFDANIYMWEKDGAPLQLILIRFVKLPVIYSIANTCYNFWASCRYYFKYRKKSK